MKLTKLLLLLKPYRRLSHDICIDNELCARTTWLQITTVTSLVFKFDRFSLSKRANKATS